MAWLTDKINRLRGFPAPLGPDQRRPPWPAGELQPNGQYRFFHYRPYSVGAPAWVVNAPQAEYDVLGGGWPARYCFRTMGPAGTYQAGAIWYQPQEVPTSVQLMGLVSPATLAALFQSLPPPQAPMRVL